MSCRLDNGAGNDAFTLVSCDTSSLTLNVTVSLDYMEDDAGRWTCMIDMLDQQSASVNTTKFGIFSLWSYTSSDSRNRHRKI